MRRTMCISALATMGLLAFVAAATSAATKNDSDLMQGTWKVSMTSSEDGSEGPAKTGDPELLVEDGKMFWLRDGKRTEPANFKLDSSKTPKEIDIMPQEGADKNETLNGIYSFDANGLRICLAVSAQRPKEFKSSEDQSVLTLVRKVDKKQPATSPSSAPAVSGPVK